MSGRRNQTHGLKPAFSPLGVLAFSIGASIGWGSFIVTCSVYLQKAGFLGTAFGLLAGLAVISVVAWNLQYMIEQSPDAGGVYAFQKRVSGNDLGFVAFWFILLVYLAVLWGNMTAVPLFVRFFLGDQFQFGLHYSVYGYDVWLGEALLSIGALALVGFLCAHCSRMINRTMIAAAVTFVAGFAVCSAVAVLGHERSFSYSPMFAADSGEFAQIVRIAAISTWAFIGFENIAHFSEEYDFPLKKVRGILIGSVVLTTALYLLVCVLSISAYPPEYDSWLAYIRDMGNLEGIKAVPAFYAANHYLGAGGIALLLLALFCVILTSLIANLLALSRLLYAAGRDGDAPESLAQVSGKGIPFKAVYAVVVISLFIPFLGRTAIGWLVDVTTLGATLVYGLAAHGVYVRARVRNRRLEQCAGLAGLALMACILLLLLVPGLLPFHAMQTESYALFIVWAVLGLFYFGGRLQRKNSQKYGQSVIVWIALLMLMMFAALMWASREAEIANNDSVADILAYHQADPQTGREDGSKQRAEFLQEQVREISSTNTRYTVFSLSLFLLFSGLLLYKNNQRIRAVAEERRRIISETERDKLTQLYSRNYFVVYAHRHYYEHPERPMDAVVMNIDRFHSVNALHGRDFGDQVLRQLGAEIKRFAGEAHGMASRSDADRFDIYCPPREDWQSQLERFQACMDGLFPNAHIHLRMGVKPWQAGQAPSAQIDCARMACNKLRNTYNKNVAVIFDGEMGHKEAHDQRLLNDLSAALERGELEVHYQPKYDIRGAVPVLDSVEALVRWRHPELGMISPGAFIPLFEKTGRIGEVDVHVWKQAARQIAQWRNGYGKTLPVSVNLSRVDVFDPGLPAQLQEIVSKNGLKTTDFKLEVTESAYTDNPDQLIEVIRQLRGQGYKIEMDDFGSGYSSLNMLSCMPIDVLKMDIAFIRNIERSEKDLHLVQMVIEIARYLNVPVVAEGVETQGQLQVLRELRCDLAQGYYFSRPLPADEFEKKILREEMRRA